MLKSFIFLDKVILILFSYVFFPLGPDWKGPDTSLAQALPCPDWKIPLHLVLLALIKTKGTRKLI